MCNLGSVAAAIIVLTWTSSTWAQIIPPPGKSSRVCLQSWMGTFVCAEGGGGGLVVVNREEAKDWETFEMTRVDESHVTLRTLKGLFLCADGGGGRPVIANRPQAGDWERFSIYLNGNNGLITLSAHNGMYLCADPTGILLANRPKAGPWESFRIVGAVDANSEQTRIEVNVYKIGVAPFWHTGTVIGDGEFYFQTNNQVQVCAPGRFNLPHHRTMVRFVPGNARRVAEIRDRVAARWNGTRYDLGNHNCDFFTDDLLKSLGSSGLDQEYLNASGLEKGLRQIPGGALSQELLVKWPVQDKRLDRAFMEDLHRMERLPADIKRELQQAIGSVAGHFGQAYHNVAGSVGGRFSQTYRNVIRGRF